MVSDVKDTLWQIHRALKSRNSLFAVLLMVYALIFVHTDAPIFYSEPFVYFRSTNFFYFFIVSFYFGITQFVVPIAAMLPLGYFLCDDQESGYVHLSLYRCSNLRYALRRLAAAALSAMLIVILTCLLVTLLLLILSPLEGGATESWLLNRKGSAFESVTTPQSFVWYILIQYAHLALSAAVWAMIAVGFSSLWTNRAFVFVATFGLSLLVETVVGKSMGEEYTLSWLQTPDPGTMLPIHIHFIRQAFYLFGAFIFAYGGLLWRFSNKIQRVKQPILLWVKQHAAERKRSSEWHLPGLLKCTATGRILTDARAFCTWQTLAPALFIPLLVMFLRSVVHTSVYSIGDLWVDVFGGIGWFEPVINFNAIGLWTLVMLPPMMGIALNLDREIRSRRLITINRFPSKQQWWSSKCLACFIYAFVCTCAMFFSVAFVGVLTGARGFALFLPDADGFMVKNYLIILKLFLLFFGQVLMLTQFQAVVHLISGRMQIGILAYILPFIASLISYSIFDRAINESIPYNWGILVRTDLFSPSFMLLENGEHAKLCAIPYGQALIKQAIAVMIIFSFSAVIIKAINITEREVKS